ncbi:UNKNOWN [Stylonychia lemnae]|uniref:Uncharacterized protein n=1 Tax=Stylonychia lemnae TaxID=5949 RepID=A0A077ZRE0_STYLE|nr:UNKNOWN [Stylonychia lemnae]|eukprot:CDW72488.1 UNKNOWN [Stylonychia lemnae]
MPDQQIWRDPTTGKSKIIEMNGTRYNCDNFGSKEANFFPKVTGNYKYQQRVNQAFNDKGNRYLPKEIDEDVEKVRTDYLSQKLKTQLQQVIEKSLSVQSSLTKLPSLKPAAQNLQVNTKKFNGYAQFPSPQRYSENHKKQPKQITIDEIKKQKRNIEQRLKDQIKDMQIELDSRRPIIKQDNPKYFDFRQISQKEPLIKVNMRNFDSNPLRSSQELSSYDHNQSGTYSTKSKQFLSPRGSVSTTNNTQTNKYGTGVNSQKINDVLTKTVNNMEQEQENQIYIQQKSEDLRSELESIQNTEIANVSHFKKLMSPSNMEDIQALRNRDYEVLTSSDENDNTRDEKRQNPFRNNRSQNSISPVRSVENLKKEYLHDKSNNQKGVIDKNINSRNDLSFKRNITYGIFDGYNADDNHSHYKKEYANMMQANPKVKIQIQQQNEKYDQILKRLKESKRREEEKLMRSQ